MAHASRVFVVHFCCGSITPPAGGRLRATVRRTRPNWGWRELGFEFVEEFADFADLALGNFVSAKRLHDEFTRGTIEKTIH